MSGKVMLRVYWFVIGFSIAYTVFFLGQFAWEEREIAEAHENIINLFNAIEPGQAEEKSVRLLVQLNKVGRISSANGAIYVASPVELMQTNWVLVVCLEDSLVSGLRVGTADEIMVVPPGAPKPKGECIR